MALSETFFPQNAVAFFASVVPVAEPIEPTPDGRLILPDELKTPHQILTTSDGNAVFVACFENDKKAHVYIRTHDKFGWHKYKNESVSAATQDDLKSLVRGLMGPHVFTYDLMHPLSGTVNIYGVIRRSNKRNLWEKSSEYMHVLPQTQGRNALTWNYRLVDGKPETIAIISGKELGLEDASIARLEQSPIPR